MPCTEPTALNAVDLAGLSALAAQVICAALDHATMPGLALDDGRFAAPGACFVTLKQQDRLRGCIGTLEAHRALRDDVAANALAAALRDPRFAPLARHEIPHTELDISVLSAPSVLVFEDERDFFRQLRVGVDGLIIEYEGRRATYLPSVWAQLPDAGLFVQELRRKAGIANNVAVTALRVQRYITQHSALRPLISG